MPYKVSRVRIINLTVWGSGSKHNTSSAAHITYSYWLLMHTNNSTGNMRSEAIGRCGLYPTLLHFAIDLNLNAFFKAQMWQKAKEYKYVPN